MIRPLTPEDAEAFFALRRASLLDAPLAFTASPEDDVASSVEAVRVLPGSEPGSVVMGALAEQQLVGCLGLRMERQLKRSHIATIWGVYVAPSHRGKGLALQLLRAVVEHATTLPGLEWLQLSVNETAPEAQRVYERAGFKVWGTEPAALRWNGCTTFERHMALRLPSR
ncbi:MAG: GNAT family N-acetyltransferase [Chthoniobacterales bacterium]|nr:GNAT family N-acetyltransferase [Chthoniobacterales bacterium]